jgi:hypothetical protein
VLEEWNAGVRDVPPRRRRRAPQRDALGDEGERDRFVDDAEVLLLRRRPEQRQRPVPDGEDRTCEKDDDRREQPPDEALLAVSERMLFVGGRSPSDSEARSMIWFAVSATECAASASSADELVTAPATPLTTATAAFAAIAYQNVFVLAPATCCCFAAGAGSESS